MLLIARILGALLAFVVGGLLRVRRAHVIDSLRAAGVGAPARVADRMYRSLGTGIGELIALALMPRKAIASVDLEQIETPEIRRWLESGRGVVVATAHTGNWDLLACAAAARVELTVVTKHLSIRFLDRLWQRLRAARGVRLVSEGNAARVTARTLARGHVTAFLIDQAPERARATIGVPFLGRPARVDLAPALVAMRARSPIVIVFSRRLPNGRHRACVRGVIEPPARPSRAWAEAAMRRATAELELCVRETPEQWLWMHRRWKDAPACASSAALAARAESV